MIIAISGSVGSGKTTIASLLLEKLNEQFKREELTILKQRKFELINLNEFACKYKIQDVKELQTFDFDIDKLVFDVNKLLEEKKILDKNIILEGHFAHFLNPEYVDFLLIINRNLKDLKQEYEKRNYNEQKIKDNLEVESFNLCFYEALEEGFEEEKQIFAIENNKNLDLIVDKILKIINFSKK